MSVSLGSLLFCVFFFKQKTAYEMRISDWSSDVCSSDLELGATAVPGRALVFLVERDAQRLKLGDVGVVVLGDVRDHRPVAGEVGAGDLPDLRQRLDLDLAELREVHLRPRQQVQTAAASGDRATTTGHRALDELLHVFLRSEEHTSELQSLMRISYAVFCLKKKTNT